MRTLPILMTASVSTRGMKGACYSDLEREGMYVGALTYYIRRMLTDGSQKIVFAENSGWDLDRLISKLPDFNPSQVEFISAPPNYLT